MDQIAGQLAQLIDGDISLLRHLLNSDYVSDAQKNLLLDSVSYAASDSTNRALRDYALYKSASSDYEEALTGLELLSSMNITIDSEVRQRLLDFGHSSQEPEVLVRVMATLANTSEPIPEKQTIVEFFNQMTQSEDETVRILAIQRLAQWNQEQGTVSMLSTQSFNSPDPTVRAFSLKALADQDAVYPHQREQLFAMLANPEEDPMVKIAAAEALDRLELSTSDVQRINAALQEEDFRLGQP